MFEFITFYRDLIFSANSLGSTCITDFVIFSAYHILTLPSSPLISSPHSYVLLSSLPFSTLFIYSALLSFSLLITPLLSSRFFFPFFSPFLSFSSLFSSLFFPPHSSSLFVSSLALPSLSSPFLTLLPQVQTNAGDRLGHRRGGEVRVRC